MNAENVEFRRLLAASGWRQARAAEALGLSTGTVSQYVSDKTVPSITVLRLFGALIGERLRLPGESPAPAGTPFVLEPWEEDLVEALRGIPAGRRKHVAESIRTVVTAYDGLVNKSPLKHPVDEGKGRDPVLEELQRKADETARLWATPPRLRKLPGRQSNNAKPS
ncbi:MAG: helix-turn-helix transcriptional regulator [Verrucomicrobia bacterium]|nr:helix-turn-helix transcriptional regulator [Verrucomicrobiota bacterium]